MNSDKNTPFNQNKPSDNYDAETQRLNISTENNGRVPSHGNVPPQNFNNGMNPPPPMNNGGFPPYGNVPPQNFNNGMSPPPPMNNVVLGVENSSKKSKRNLIIITVSVASALIVIVTLFVLTFVFHIWGNNKMPQTDRQKNNLYNSYSDNSTSDDSSLPEHEGFSTVSETQNAVFEGNLILVNKQHEYCFPTSSDIVPVYTKKTESYQVCDYETSLSSDTISAINSMMDKFYEKTGHNDVMIIGGYRTKEYQDEKFSSDSSDAKSGFSEFHTGMSFDLAIFPEGENSFYYTAEGDYSWILENCANYGFILRYPEKKEDLTGMDSKSYQFRYVGIPHAIYMMQNDMCFEEYIEFVKNYTYQSEHLTVAGPDKNYEIYYVPADSSANTDVPVPSDKSYEISGNNVDGFIVTVEI